MKLIVNHTNPTSAQKNTKPIVNYIIEMKVTVRPEDKKGYPNVEDSIHRCNLI